METVNLVSDDELRAAIAGAFATRGANKGRLLASKPRGLAGAAWNAVMLNANPWKFSMGAMLLGNAREREVFHRVQHACDGLPRASLIALDRDAATLAVLGVL